MHSTQPKQPFRPNVKTTYKSSNHGNVYIVLTFGCWFGGAFLSMGAKKSAISVGRISTFVKVGIVGLAKTSRTHNTQNTTQKSKNTQQPT